MIGGSNKEPKKWVIITGLGAVKPLLVNPTNEQYEEMTGQSLPFELNYDVTELSEVKYRPIKILVHNSKYNVFNFVNFWISDEDEISKAGDKVNSMDPKGVITYKPINGDVDYNWFDSANAVPLKRGEASLHNFLQVLVKYDNKAEEAQWRIDLASAGVTAEKLFRGDVTGLQALLDWAGTQPVGDSGIKGHQVGVLFEVKKSPKVDKDTGNEVPGEFNYNQVINNRNFFYASADGEISKGSYKKLKSTQEKQEEQGYPLTKNLWTFSLQEFDESKCEGSEPSTELDSEDAPVMKWV